jgi:hypothetical protein
MLKPSEDSIQLAQIILDNEVQMIEPIALIIGRVMELNYDQILEVLKKHREAFKALGAETQLSDLESDIALIFIDFFNANDVKG